ncbi:MAG: hypothetical protein M1370_09770 [Bacteroidetes bacterium]|nr:hypothetical protein [Bacteroidota bacterium]
MQMRLQTSTSLKPAEVLERAVKFFGEGGLGLKLEQRTEDTLYLTGGGGSITVSVAPGARTIVEFVEREWEQQMKEFIQGLPK